MGTNSLLGLAAQQEDAVRQARGNLNEAIRRRNETVKALRSANASYAAIAGALGLTRAGAVGICRKIEVADVLTNQATVPEPEALSSNLRVLASSGKDVVAMAGLDSSPRLKPGGGIKTQGQGRTR